MRELLKNFQTRYLNLFFDFFHCDSLCTSKTADVPMFSLPSKYEVLKTIISKMNIFYIVLTESN